MKSENNYSLSCTMTAESLIEESDEAQAFLGQCTKICKTSCCNLTNFMASRPHSNNCDGHSLRRPIPQYVHDKDK
jgi:hypothetical protein